MSEIAVIDQGSELRFRFADMLRYAGPGSPGGVAHAFKVMERAWPMLAPGGAPERREVVVATAFAGPGARDAFELVTRAVSEQRYVVDAALARPERGVALERFVFRLSYGGRTVTLTAREGTVTDEFLGLARTERRSDEQEARLTALKAEMAERTMAAAAEDVYDAEG